VTLGVADYEPADGIDTTGTESLDLYALAGERSREVVGRFREHWLAGFEDSEVDYMFPRFADEPEAVYASPWDLIDRLLAEPTQPHSVYWRNPRPAHVLHAMLFFTTDGGLIAGLTVDTHDPVVAGNTLRHLAESVDGRYGYAKWEQPPPDTMSEFVAEARATKVLPRLLPDA
jgi:hypothetical protein